MTDEPRYHVEFKLGTTPQGEWIVGALIDGVLQRYRGPYGSEAEAIAGRDAWVAELKAKGEEHGEEMHAIH
jgi:hypothetical protein